MPVHPIAESGFGSVAHTYEAARPGYPTDAVSWMIDRLEVRPGLLVVDLGAGTGKFTRELVGRGATVLAVEPVGDMRTVLTETTPQAIVVGGDAEALPLRSASVDGLTLAQAFHWVDTPTTRAELARVIRSGGRLGLIWNARLRSEPWLDAFWTIMDRVEKRAPWRNHDRATESGRRLPGFSRFETAHFLHDHIVTPDLLMGRLASVSHVATLPDTERKAVLGEAWELITTHPATRRREYLTVQYRVDCYVAARVPDDEPGE